jgi:hypothetical protein
LKATNDSLAGSSTLRKGPMTTYRVWKEHLKSSAPKSTEKYTKEIGLVLNIGVKKNNNDFIVSWSKLCV